MKYISLQMKKCIVKNIRLIKMFHATIALLLFHWMLANGQKRNAETIPGEDNNGANNGQDNDNGADPGENGGGENNETVNTTAPTTTTAATSPSTSTTSGGSAIFSTKSLVLSIMLPLKFLHA